MIILKKHMKQYGLRAVDVARMTGIPVRTVRAHLNGERLIGAGSALMYSRGLGLSLEQLVRDRENGTAVK